MKKRIYRRMPVNDFQPETISHADLGGKLVFAIDVAKVDMVAAIAAGDGRVLQTICWKASSACSTALGAISLNAAHPWPSSMPSRDERRHITQASIATVVA